MEEDVAIAARADLAKCLSSGCAHHHAGEVAVEDNKTLAATVEIEAAVENNLIEMLLKSTRIFL